MHPAPALMTLLRRNEHISTARIYYCAFALRGIYPNALRVLELHLAVWMNSLLSMLAKFTQLQQLSLCIGEQDDEHPFVETELIPMIQNWLTKLHSLHVNSNIVRCSAELVQVRRLRICFDYVTRVETILKTFPKLHSLYLDSHLDPAEYNRSFRRDSRLCWRDLVELHSSTPFGAVTITKWFCLSSKW